MVISTTLSFIHVWIYSMQVFNIKTHSDMDSRFIFYKVRIINEDFINPSVTYGLWPEMSPDFYLFPVVTSNISYICYSVWLWKIYKSCVFVTDYRGYKIGLG